MTDRWERLTDLYHAAVALPAEERATLLIEECGDDPALQADVQRLIAAHDRASQVADPVDADADPDTQPVGIAPANRQLGPYTVIREIGRGPNGIVYLAQREDGRSDQKVAIKALAQSIDTTLLQARLRSDLQMLSARDHATITRIIDIDSDGGQAYVVSEYIQGEPIDAYADARRLSIAERLQLFLQVAAGVTFAHRRRVIHGNLAPSNILVTSAGMVKLLDFNLDELQATPATDIVALGDVLDKLLGGGEAHGSRRRLRGDLDTIVLTALNKNPDRRYDSVDHLADEVRRYLESPAARARPEAPAPRPAARPARRSRGAWLAWMLAAVALVALGVSMMSLMTERAETVAAAPVAEPRSRRERIFVSDFADHTNDPQLAAALSDAFRAGLGESPTMLVSASRSRATETVVTTELRPAAAGFTITTHVTRPAGRPPVDAISETAADSSDVMRALNRVATRLRQALGEPASSVGSTSRLDEVSTASLPALRAYASGVRAANSGDRAGAVKLLKSAIALDTGYATAQRQLAATYGELGDRERASDALDHAVSNQARIPFYDRNFAIGNYAMTVGRDYATAVDAYNRILDRWPNDTRALVNLAAVHAARHEYAAQESLFVRAIGVDPNVASFYAGLATAQVNQGKYDEARTTLDRSERRFPNSRSAAMAGIALAASQQDWAAAERQARAQLAPSAGDDSTDALDGLETLASIVMTQGRLSEAEQGYRRILALGGKSVSAKRALSAAARIAYMDLRYRHAPNRAIATMSAALTRMPLEKLSEADRPYDLVARLFADAGQPARARQIIDQAAQTRLGRQRTADADRGWTRGSIAIADGRVWEGEIEIIRASDNLQCPICALPDLARSYEVAGKPDSAIATYERYLHAPWGARYETDALELGFAMRRLGELYEQQHDRAKAKEAYAGLLSLWNRADAELEPVSSDVRQRLAGLGNRE
jgi:tetratricopeptide (TPR) repeat protein/tRNA A-37 threonylcarbamoyl transferase component Bud32